MVDWNSVVDEWTYWKPEDIHLWIARHGTALTIIGVVLFGVIIGALVIYYDHITPTWEEIQQRKFDAGCISLAQNFAGQVISWRCP